MQFSAPTTSYQLGRPEPQLRTTLATIPAWLVHKNVSGTPLTYLMEYADDRVQIGCDLGADRPDTLHVIEAFRQGVMAVCHTVYGTPLSWAFAMNGIAAELTARGEVLLRNEPALAMRMSFQPQRRDGRLSAADITAVLVHGDDVVGTASGTLVLLPPEVYLRLRNGQLPRDFHSPLDRVDPAQVGVESPGDVLLGACGDGEQQTIALDTDHLAFCDHAVDHVPGMTLLEAVRQALVLRGRRGPRAWSVKFLRFVELEAPLVIDLPSGDGAVGEVRVLQDGEPVLIAHVG